MLLENAIAFPTCDAIAAEAFLVELVHFDIKIMRGVGGCLCLFFL